MTKQTKDCIRKAGYVIKGLSNSERMKIIKLLKKGEMSAVTITTNLNVGKRETLRHLRHLVEIKIVKKERSKVNLRTNRYTLNLKTYELYISCIKRMTA